MEASLIEVAAVLIGFLLRLGIPIALTIVAAMFLNWLDKRWQSQAEMEKAELQSLVQSGQPRRPCWEIHNCSDGLKKNCKAYANPDIPCWELFRIDGRLKPACRNCKVLPPEVPGQIVIA